jgi:hypothetical protein
MEDEICDHAPAFIQNVTTDVIRYFSTTRQRFERLITFTLSITQNNQHHTSSLCSSHPLLSYELVRSWSSRRPAVRFLELEYKYLL